MLPPEIYWLYSSVSMLREQGHRIWLLVSNSKIQRQKGIWRQVSSSVIPVLARQTALAVEVLTASAGREGVRNRETHRITGLCTSSRCSPSLWGEGGAKCECCTLTPLLTPFFSKPWLANCCGGYPQNILFMLAPRSRVMWKTAYTQGLF